MTDTNDIKALLSVIIDKLNRIEANVAQAKPAEKEDNAPAKAAIDRSIALLDAAQSLYAQNSKEYASIVAELKAHARKADGRLLDAF